MANAARVATNDFPFYDFLLQFYRENRRKIRQKYRDLTKKFLDFNDKKIRPNAYLRVPQFEALEMYVFLKEGLGNKQIYDIFDEWYNRTGAFAEDSVFYTNAYHNGQISFFDMSSVKYKDVFNAMRRDAAAYPNYIYALTMGLGKTVLIATCIFYEFLLANKWPKDEKYCHNALVFAPDKTVLESLREIVTMDKSLVVPAEYCHILDTNIKFHFLDDTGLALNTLDNSDFNIVISNTQKIIKKRSHKEKTAAQQFMSMPSRTEEFDPFTMALQEFYGYDDRDESELATNQRFEKLARLKQLGIYVDEAHHLFGNELDSSLKALRVTINELARELAAKDTHVVACYQYTGTPYLDKTVMPEVVYSYGLRDAINYGYLKNVSVVGYENVRSGEFLSHVIKEFWERYGGKSYDGLLPKFAIFGATVEEVVKEIRPTVEKILSELDIPLDKILVNVGDETITKHEDIRHFNDLDRAGTAGSQKQFILLCNKGREGWNCRSLFGVALYRSPKSKVFVLQATMRCLRQITSVQQEAMVRLSKENFDILDAELNKKFRMDLDGLINSKAAKKQVYQVHLRKNIKIKVKQIHRNFSSFMVRYDAPIDFGLDLLDLKKYKSFAHEKRDLASDITIRSKEIRSEDQYHYSEFMLIGEINRYLRSSFHCDLIKRILRESKDGVEKVLDYVNRYNQILYDVIIPKIFSSVCKISCDIQTEEREADLLQLPEGKEFYEFTALPELVENYLDSQFARSDKTFGGCIADKSFHTDNYCFDSMPEKQCFLHYIFNERVKEIYFTGMFTNQYNGLAVQYIDPETQAVRSYYPDFILVLDDGTIEIVEVKAEAMIDDKVTRAKAEAAMEMAAESKMVYKILPDKAIMNGRFETESHVNGSLL